MSQLRAETVTHVHHWNSTLFSFKTTRDPGFRFKNGHFTMIGLQQEKRPLLRAYSIASANYEEEMEFFSIKVPDGPLTSQLQKLQVGDQILVNSKPTGTLTIDNIRAGKRLWLLATGTGLAPFLSIIRAPETYEQFDQVIVTHGVRQVSELAYRDHILEELPKNEYFGEQVAAQLHYYPTVTREPFERQGRLTDLLNSGQASAELGFPDLNPSEDRFLICGSPAMLNDFCEILGAKGFTESRQGELGEYAIERAFVEK